MIEFKNRKKDITSLYRDLVECTKGYRESDANKDKSYVMFGAIAGKYYEPGGIMICGRSPNGWHRYDVSTNELFEGNDAIFDIPEKLTIIRNENKRSRLWKVTDKLCSVLLGTNWEQHIVYTNVCKIAPDEDSEKNGTPPKRLRAIQKKCCKEILSLELDFFKPKHIIAYTGCKVESNFDFTENLMEIFYKIDNDNWPKPLKTANWDNGKYAVEVYKLFNTYIYLTEHPDRKKIEEHFETILKLINEFQ